MYKIFCLIALLSWTQVSLADSSGSPTKVPSFTLPGTATYEFTSESLGRTYPVYVSVPRGYKKSHDKPYPLVIMNDGTYAFPFATGALSVPMSMGKLEQVIIVGIGFSVGDNMMLSRIRDYSPSEDPNWKQFQPGQAKQYLNFLKAELLPFIEQHYAVDATKRTLVGHSAGGLFASYVLLNQPELFESYVILSPALFWNNRLLFEHEKHYASHQKDLNARVYFATGSKEVPPATPFNWVTDQQDFVAQLTKRNYPNLMLKTEILPEALHETSFPIGFVKGMQWLYSK